MCYFQCAMNYCLIVVSMMTLGFISIDRFVHIAYPLRYHDIMSVRRIRIMIVWTWIQGLIIGEYQTWLRRGPEGNYHQCRLLITWQQELSLLENWAENFKVKSFLNLMEMVAPTIKLKRGRGWILDDTNSTWFWSLSAITRIVVGRGFAIGWVPFKIIFAQPEQAYVISWFWRGDAWENSSQRSRFTTNNRHWVRFAQALESSPPNHAGVSFRSNQSHISYQA